MKIIDTPCGRFGIIATHSSVTGIRFCNGTPVSDQASDDNDSPLLRQAARELEQYFAGSRRDFTFPVKVAGTPFQQRVWQALQTIPYGETRTYAQIAAQIGQPNASRAVGMANHRNPLPVVVPCHRVIGTNGKLTGYAGGVGIKEYLLTLERIEKKG